MLNESTIKEMISKANLVFPEDPLAVGGTWARTSEMNLGSAIFKTNTNLEYLGVTEEGGKPFHVIRGNITISFPDGLQAMDVGMTKKTPHSRPTSTATPVELSNLYSMKNPHLKPKLANKS